jgi:hypothetical protein
MAFVIGWREPSADPEGKHLAGGDMREIKNTGEGPLRTLNV